jgi:hypothetical protein
MTPITKDRVDSLLETIKEAKIAGATGPEWRDVAAPRKAAAETIAIDVEDVDFPVAERYESSQFWGNVLEANEPPTPLAYSLAASNEALRLSLPLPPMPSTVSEAREKLGAAPSQTAPAPQAAPEPELEDTTPKIFTVKELGGPRKRKVTPVEQPNEEPLIPLTELDPTEKEHKKSRKEKKAKKAAQSGSNSDADSAPFDYGAADSVLNAPKVKGKAAPPRRHFNPYAKAMDAPSGVRKERKETPGKSLTFRK